MALLVCDQGILGLFETGATDEEGTGREIFESALVRELDGSLAPPIGVDINPHPRLCCDGEPNRRVHTRRIPHPLNPPPTERSHLGSVIPIVCLTRPQ